MEKLEKCPRDVGALGLCNNIYLLSDRKKEIFVTYL